MLRKIVKNIVEDVFPEVTIKKLEKGGRYLFILPSDVTLSDEDYDTLAKELELEENDIRIAFITADMLSIVELLSKKE